ncbi:MAG: NUDIX domain-containing protein [Microlunatus sp.]|nr:NUDIX domain-containing protein [Microlunatus sp.]
MRIIGQDRQGARLVAFDLAHGDDPAGQLAGRGFRTIRPIDAVGADGDLTITMLAEPDSRIGARTAPEPRPVRDPDVTADEYAVPRQRVAAYAWVESRRGILASEFHRPAPGGRWGLPGGGIDSGEEPVAAVHREVMEETSQQIDLGDLVAVDTRHWIGRNPAGIVEDFQAVRLIYRATCPEPTDPVVIDVGGTTTSAAWFPYETWQDHPWNTGWRQLVVSLFG